jgi:hypothetical protein
MDASKSIRALTVPYATCGCGEESTNNTPLRTKLQRLPTYTQGTGSRSRHSYSGAAENVRLLPRGATVVRFAILSQGSTFFLLHAPRIQ